MGCNQNCNQGRTCDCAVPESKLSIADGRDEIYYAWRKYWAWGIPSKDGEAVFNANGDGFQAGWLACEKWMKDNNSDGRS